MRSLNFIFLSLTLSFLKVLARPLTHVSRVPLKTCEREGQLMHVMTIPSLAFSLSLTHDAAMFVGGGRGVG